MHYFSFISTMKPQLIFAILFIAAHCVMAQAVSQLHQYYNAEGCNTTESLVAQIQIGIIPDGCSERACTQNGDLWVSVACNVSLSLVDNFSYVSRFMGSDCNDTMLDERVIFNRNTTTACLNVITSSYSISINNTCNANGNITIERHTSVDCSAGDVIESTTGSDGTCDNSVYAFCSVDAPQTSPSASEPTIQPESSPTSSPTAPTSPNTNTPKSSTPKASNTGKLVAVSFTSILSAVLLL